MVTPASPSPKVPRRKLFTYFERFSCCWTASKGSGTFPVYNTDTGDMGKISIVQIFVQMSYGFIDSHADEINFRADQSRFGHADLAPLPDAFFAA